MKTQIVTGSKSEIIESVQRIEGVIREVIVIIEEPADAVTTTGQNDLFAEMEPFTVRAGGADYSRESLYCRQEGE